MFLCYVFVNFAFSSQQEDDVSRQKSLWSNFKVACNTVLVVYGVEQVHLG